LRRCIRLYSHQNNSGNFFIAVFKKLFNTDELFEKQTITQNLSNDVIQKSIGDDLAEFAKFLGIKDDELQKENKIDMTEINTEVNSIMKKEQNKNDGDNSNDVVFKQFVKFKEYKENYNNVKI
jgi:hypothetical protein